MDFWIFIKIKGDEKTLMNFSKLRTFWMKIFQIFIMIILVFVFSLVNGENKKAETTKEEMTNFAQMSEESEKIPENIEEYEMRAVWIPFMALQVRPFSREKFESNYRNIIEKVKELKLNTVFVHVRPFNDAVYKSRIFPWSHILTGNQGEDPGFDPLDFMISFAHENGIKFHAWVNPMRIKNKEFPGKLDKNNPYVLLKEKDPENFKKYTVTSEEYTYFDPQYEWVRNLITDGILEIAENYDVDGINFDDYFYPGNNHQIDSFSTQIVSKNDPNEETKNQNEVENEKKKENINKLISQVYSAITRVNESEDKIKITDKTDEKSTTQNVLKEKILFGICPQANFKNLEISGVDPKTWVEKEGYVDYICPEIYTNSKNPILPFDKAIHTWRDLIPNRKVKLYAGLGLYKTGSSEYDDGTWEERTDIIRNQIEQIREINYDGFALYSSVYLFSEKNQNEIQNIKGILN